MKTRLNIISFLILAVFIYAAGYEIYLGTTDFRQGFREGYNRSDRSFSNSGEELPSFNSLGETYYVKLLLDTEGDMPVDSIYNSATGQFYPVEYTGMKFYSQQKASFKSEISGIISSLFMLFIFPLLCICFWKVISSVKRAEIFERSNVRRLRLIGLYLCMLALLIGIPKLIGEIEAKKILAIEGYSIISGEWFVSSLWIYALISFLVAEIFAIGLRLKEEQDLTI